MPSNPAKITITGLSSTFGYPVWMPDIYAPPPFNIGIGVVVNSTGITYNVEHSFDYLGAFSSNFVGWVSSAATWFVNGGISSQSTNAQGNYDFSVTAIRLNVTAGSSTGMATMTLIQAG